jgi:hypothetical protein
LDSIANGRAYFACGWCYADIRNTYVNVLKHKSRCTRKPTNQPCDCYVRREMARFTPISTPVPKTEEEQAPTEEGW